MRLLLGRIRLESFRQQGAWQSSRCVKVGNFLCQIVAVLATLVLVRYTRRSSGERNSPSLVGTLAEMNTRWMDRITNHDTSA